MATSLPCCLKGLSVNDKVGLTRQRKQHVDNLRSSPPATDDKRRTVVVTLSGKFPPGGTNRL